MLDLESLDQYCTLSHHHTWMILTECNESISSLDTDNLLIALLAMWPKRVHRMYPKAIHGCPKNPRTERDEESWGKYIEVPMEIWICVDVHHHQSILILNVMLDPFSQTNPVIDIWMMMAKVVNITTYNLLLGFPLMSIKFYWTWVCSSALRIV